VSPPAPRAGVSLWPSTLLRLTDALGATTTDPSLARTEQQAAATGEPPHTAVSAAPALRYEQLGLLGEGGMGRVERVRDRDLLREVALKHLRPELLHDPDSLEQFLWEARVTASLDHPNIVPVHELGVSPAGELFFSMKLVHGATLESLIANARESRGAYVSRNKRLRLFLQLCNAVSFAHSRGVLHRDLKPSNVMVGEYGETLVTDWGLAVPLPGPAGEPWRELMPAGLSLKSAGTPLYMSPEQAVGETLDARSDIYTLGVILYELVALRGPYRARSVAEVLSEIVKGLAVPLARAAPSASSSLACVVHKAMAFEPAQRYQSATELARDLEQVLEGQTPDAEQISLLTRAARYYVARDPAMAHLRVVDIDQWAFSAMLVGAGVAVLTSRWYSSTPRLGWLLLLAACLLSLPPTLRWLRLRRQARKG
jgi:serine/threonine protein kinase